MNHEERILDQFTRQAIPFSEAPSMADTDAIDRLIDATGCTPDAHCLDVACGPGLVVLRLAERVSSATGIDTTPAMIERARDLARSRSIANVRWHVGSAYELPFADQSFDATLCRFAFHHLETPERALREMIRVTRVGGTITVCDGVASEDPNKAAAFNAFERLRDPSTVRFLTLVELHAVFAACGLSVAREPVEREIRYRVPATLEGLMRASFPEPQARDRVRQCILDSIATDALGMGTRESAGKVEFGYPAVILSATKSSLR
jgi:ubiquinone/menaquinone biosynthesis C-methylase UbiE